MIRLIDILLEDTLTERAALSKVKDFLTGKNVAPRAPGEPMIRLTELLLETTENRVNLMKLEVLMEKFLPELTKTQNTTLTQLCLDVHTMSGTLNMLPYTIHNATEWKLLHAALMLKLLEVKREAEKLTNHETINIKPFINALDELIVA